MGLPAEIKVRDLHDTYVKISGMEVALRFNREASWVEYIRAGFNQADLTAVLNRLLALVKTGDRRPECLKFSNVVEGLDRFEEELAMIKAEKSGLLPSEPKLSVMELHRVIEAKQLILNDLIAKHAHENAFGLSWDMPGPQSEAVSLRKEIRALQQRLSQMA